MRWERLFDELEAQYGDLELQQRDALVDELRDGEWAETSWRSLLGGMVAVDVLGVGRIAGECVLINEHVLQLRSERTEHIVSSNAVVSVISSERRADPSSVVSAALGWGHIFRALRDEGEPVRLHAIDGSTFDGAIEVVGADFVRMREESGRCQTVTLSAVAVVSGRT